MNGIDGLAEHYAIALMMKRYGGSFAQGLGEALACADHKNQAKIKATWPEMWDQYKDFALRAAEKDGYIA